MQHQNEVSVAFTRVRLNLAHLWLINFVGAIFKIYAGIMVWYMQAAKIKFAAIYRVHH